MENLSISALWHEVVARAFWITILCAGSVVAQQAPTIRVPVRLVTVPTLVVSSDGKYVPGLSAADFHVTDNGRPQQIKLDLTDLPISVVVAVQANRGVRDFLEFIAKTGALVENSLAPAAGDSALITYSDEIKIAKPFGEGELQLAMEAVAPSGFDSKMIDAGIRAIELLKEHRNTSSRVLIFIGQAVENGSSGNLDALEASAERENVQIYTLTLPVVSKALVSDSFALQGFGSQWYKGGWEARLNLTKAVPALRRAAQSKAHSDPFSLLTVATGGIQLHFRRQKELENAIIGLGDALRSRYLLSYQPDHLDPGYHNIAVSVDVPDAIVYTRPGYRITAEPGK
jgi:VWFA-related protein